MTKITDHLEQPDGYTCQSAAIAKVLGKTTHHEVWDVRSALLEDARRSGTMSGDPNVMGRHLAPRVEEYHYNPKASLNDIVDWVVRGKGYEVIIHGFTTSAGHVWGIEDATPRNDPSRVNFQCDDPWYEMDFPRNEFTRRSGANVVYSDCAIWAYCVMAWNNAQAVEAYARALSNVHDEDFQDSMYETRGAWVHFIKN